jgi:agmatine deiminase
MEQEQTWLKMVAAPYQHETVYFITSDEQQRDHVVYQLDYFGIGPDGFENQIIANFDVWARVNGPIFIANDQGDLAITDWNFNGR